MDRQIIYPGQIAIETDLLNTSRNVMISIGKLAGALFGTAGVVNGLIVAPGGALTVSVGAGEIYQLGNVDNTAYSSLAADTTNTAVKQGIMLAAQLLACAAPGTVGQSINYLIQATYQDSDTGAVVLPYYNASNPTQAYSGPTNNGVSQATRRSGIVVLNAKAGTAATTGSQVTPAADSGYIALASVTVAYGATTIVAGNIASLSPPGATVSNTSYRTLLNASGYISAAAAVGSYALGQGIAATRSTVGTASPSDIFYLDPADYPGGKLRIRSTVITNAVAPGSIVNTGLYAVTRGSGAGAGLVSSTLGSQVAGSGASAGTLTANLAVNAVGSDFNLPAAGFYTLGFDTDTAIATSAHVHISAILQIH
jgi:hypothetical protein